MNENQNLDIIISRYEKEVFSNSSDMFGEKSLISALKSSLEWKSYSDEQRSEFHKVVHSIARKTNNLKPFEYQILILEIYDIMLDVYKTLKNDEKESTTFKLLSIITVCKYYKNEFRDLSKMNIYPFKILLDFVNKNSNRDSLLAVQYELKLIEGKIEQLIRLSSLGKEF